MDHARGGAFCAQQQVVHGCCTGRNHLDGTYKTKNLRSGLQDNGRGGGSTIANVLGAVIAGSLQALCNGTANRSQARLDLLCTRVVALQAHLFLQIGLDLDVAIQAVAGHEQRRPCHQRTGRACQQAVNGLVHPQLDHPIDEGQRSWS
ncbi:MAG: hypothetical protein C4K60_11825 [Ideonella sp. MAG2]|nr:MAG: hypothetical protein C4K60_11825 [Ideonella sp. MAG2]